MKISVIIPIYNVAKFIERCLLSVLNQTYNDVEIILVNDATPDNSVQIAEEIIKNHPKKEIVKIVHHPENKGLAAARNTGVKNASGEYIFFLDSDDEISNDCLEILSFFVKNDSIDLVIGEIEVIGGKRNDYPSLSLAEGIYHGNQTISNAFLQKKWYEMAWNKLIKRKIFTEKEVWFTEGILHEDTLWSFQLALQIDSMAIIHAKTYFYHIHNNSITQKKSQKNIEDFFFILKEMIVFSNERNLFQTHPSIYPYLENLRFYFIKTLSRNSFPKEFITQQKKKLDELFNNNVWINKKQSLISWLKELVWAFGSRGSETQKAKATE